MCVRACVCGCMCVRVNVCVHICIWVLLHYVFSPLTCNIVLTGISTFLCVSQMISHQTQAYQVY